MSKRTSESDLEPAAKKHQLGCTGSLPSMEIDENLQSRQLAVYGRDAMKRMTGAAVLISGLNGLGMEIAKNVTLAGVRTITLHDTTPVSLGDLSAQFYLAETDVGKNRAEACLSKLAELNPAVVVKAIKSELNEALLKQYQVVVLTGGSLAEAQRVDAICHAQTPAIPFIHVQTRGVFAQVFTDFGPSFTVLDVDGEEPHTGIVASVMSGSPALVTCVEDERLEFQDGELVQFSEVLGMPELSKQPVKVKSCKAHSFMLDLDTSEFQAYERGGIVTQVKEPKVLAFKTLQNALADPGEFLLSDFAKLDRSALLHLGFQALDAFQVEKGHAPRPANVADADHVIALAKKLNEAASSKAEVDEGVLRKLASNAGAEINPMAAMFGGFVGQEVVKAVSGKFHPLFQWLYFDSIESLPEGDLPESEFAPTGSRYDGQVAVFGKTLQAKLGASKIFLVGAGALGCEFLKNFSMMGLGCTVGGEVTVTDDDTIEKSNLTRQFLFRNHHIGSAKSTVAATAAKGLNPAFNIKPLQNRVSPETEGVFNDAFWQNLDLVVNALDNVHARLYVDSRCVYFCKPLLESGTLGAKCNTQMVIPLMTENYGASRDPPEKQAPMCTVHSFPHNIDHCLTWARSEFEGMLEKAPSEANTYLEDPTKYVNAIKASADAAAREQLEKVVDVLATDRCTTFEECIAWARLRFHDYFHARIAQLVYTLPEDASTSTGAPFWSAPKRFPHALTFDSADVAHASFVQAGAILKAEVYGIAVPDWGRSTAKVAAAAAKVHVDPFVPKQGVRIETDPKATGQPSTLVRDDESVITTLINRLEEARTKLPAGFKLHTVQFEKDDDSNYHMDLIAGLANMRARNYEVTEVDKLKAKLIAGRIIPAISTATSVATGLVCLEVYKVLQGKKIEDYRNTFANLALPLFAMAEPIAPKVMKHQELSWSLWDRWILEGDLTVQEVLDWFVAKDLIAYSISCGQSLLYNNIFPKHKERLGTKMRELVKSVAKIDIPKWRSHFDVVVACEDAEGEDLDVPLVSIKFK